MQKPVPLITDLRFTPIRRNGSHIGFMSFLYDANIAIKDIAVHQRADKNGFRLVYPMNPDVKRPIMYPINKETQELIDEEVTCYINANCKSITSY